MDFAVQFPYPIVVSGKAFVDVVLLNNSFYTIRDDENDALCKEVPFRVPTSP